MPLAHSLHLIVFTTWDGEDEIETLTYTDGTDARAMYDLLREDPTTRHARLFHNPVPNGGVFDGTRPVPPEPEPLAPEKTDEPPVNPGALPLLPDGALPPAAPPSPFAAAAPAAPAPPPAATSPAESPELKLS